MDCSMCSKPVAPERIAVVPQTLTCSAACSRERDLWRKRQGAKRQRERAKAERRAIGGL